MTNRQHPKTIGLSLFVGAVILISLTLLVFQNYPGLQSNSADSNCVDTPAPPPVLTGTPTPDYYSTSSSSSADEILPTQIPIAETIDLAPDSAPENKAKALVFRCNGDLVLYLYDMYDELSVVPLGDGDTIYITGMADSVVGQHINPDPDTGTPESPVLTATPEPIVSSDSDTGIAPTALQPESESTSSAYP